MAINIQGPVTGRNVTIAGRDAEHRRRRCRRRWPGRRPREAAGRTVRLVSRLRGHGSDVHFAIS